MKVLIRASLRGKTLHTYNLKSIPEIGSKIWLTADDAIFKVIDVVLVEGIRFKHIVIVEDCGGSI